MVHALTVAMMPYAVVLGLAAALAPLIQGESAGHSWS